MKTKYGNANIKSNGYYWITSTKEGNYGKYLHRLIWEDFYDCKVPEGYNIHHKNHNKLDNCILNLQLINASEHIKLHMTGENNHNYGKHHSEETKMKMSESHKGKTLSDETKQKISENHIGMLGKTHSEDSMMKISKANNTSSYFRITKQKGKQYKQGYTWRYNYLDKDGKQKAITSVDIKKLEEKVKALGLKWYKFEKKD